MFKSIYYLRYDYETDSSIYKLIDTDFECEVTMAVSSLAPIVIEYKKRNYSHKEILKNLLRCNICMCNEFCCTFEQGLNYENTNPDNCYKDTNFSKLYYQDLKDMWDKHKVFV